MRKEIIFGTKLEISSLQIELISRAFEMTFAECLEELLPMVTGRVINDIECPFLTEEEDLHDSPEKGMSFSRLGPMHTARLDEHILFSD